MQHDRGFKIAKVLVVGAAFFLGLSYVVMMLWNGVIPDVFNTDAHLTLYQAMGLLVLSKILFGSSFFGGGGCCAWKGSCQKSQWKQRFYQKWNKVQKPCKEDDMPSQPFDS